MDMIALKVKKLPHCHSLPAYASLGAAGMDLTAAIEDEVVLRAGERMRMPTGVEIEIPPGYQGQVVPRSGLADRGGISLTNCVGTIDCDYRGEVQVLLINHGTEPFTFKRGDRVAQLVLVPIPRVEVQEVEELSPTVRDRGGFGSTGQDWHSHYKGQR